MCMNLSGWFGAREGVSPRNLQSAVSPQLHLRPFVLELAYRSVSFLSVSSFLFLVYLSDFDDHNHGIIQTTLGPRSKS